MVDALFWAASFFLVLFGAYMITRGISFAYFKTKLEYLKELRKQRLTNPEGEN